MASGPIMDAPICLIKNTPEGMLETNPAAIDILSKIQQPVVVVSIVGLYRTGKSYLMNKLAGAQKGFNLGYNVQAETKGIWMWCVPHPTRHNCTLVLLDTEGLGDVEKGDTKNDIRIFCMAVLLSSALVYNSKGTIDQDALNKLKFVGDLAELIKVKSKENDDEEAEFSEHFPIFIWAVRDFTLGLVIDGKPITEDEYLENALKLRMPEKTMKNQEYNKPRNYIRMYFSSRKCFVFDQPSADKVVLQRMEEVSERDLKPEFVAQSKRFCDYVFSKAEVKRVMGIPVVTGKRLAVLAKMYTETISSSNPACMEDVVLSLSETENKAAVQEATQYYENKMKERVVFPTENLDHFLVLSRQCETEALQIFMRKSFKDEGQKFQEEFIRRIEKIKEEFCKMNETQSRERCECLIRKLSAEFEAALADGSYSVIGGHKNFTQALKDVKEKYNMETGKGVQAEAVLNDYLQSKDVIGKNILKNDNALNANAKKMEEEKAEREKEMREMQLREKEASENHLKLQHQMKSLEDNTEQLNNKLAEETRRAKEDLDRVMEEKKKEMERYEKEKSKDAEMFKQQIKDLEAKKKELNNPPKSNPFLDVLSALVNTVVPPIIGVLVKKCLPK